MAEKELDTAAKPAAKKEKEKAKKQVPLRLNAALYDELCAWAEDEFRSVNGQIEYLLTEAVRNRRNRNI